MALRKQLKEVKAKLLYWNQYPVTNYIGKLYRSYHIEKYEHEKQDLEEKLLKLKKPKDK